MPAPNEITIAQLNRLIGTPNCPEIINLCIDEDFEADPYLIPGSRRMSHRNLPAIAASLRGTRVIVSCQKGKKLSQGVAAWLRAEGINAVYLQGGMYGWRGAPDTMRLSAGALPAPVGATTLWVTRHRPKIERIACPWLIRRFVDPNARFLFVAPDEVQGVAENFGAVPFDVDGVAFGHSGANCTFDRMLDVFALTSPALQRLATLVRAADTNCHDLHPAAAGLLAVSVGLSRLHRDDQEQLKAGITLYDALYRWARDGYEEVHDESRHRRADRTPIA